MKNLINEIHRRSLWQVLGIYLAVSWIVLQVIDVLANNIGLPAWVAPTALALLLVGLPVVVATAFVQEGLGNRANVDPAAATDPGHGDEAEVGEVETSGVAVPASAGGHRRILTWRNALVGGVAAFAVLGVLTAGYLFMRTSGIGPAGTLVAQGVLEDGAEVILADFESLDPDLADVVTGALRIDLVQSPTIRVVERASLSGALERMELDADAPITTEVGRELAAREGYGAVIEGEIGTAGAGYVLTASIVAGEDGTSLAGFRATARGDDDLIDAIESLSRDIRDKAGESLRTVRAAQPLSQVSTGSLEALRHYSRAIALEQGDRTAAVEFYERAIDADPDFAMAHRKLGVLLGNLGIRPVDEVNALTRAYELRERLPEAERYLAEAYYQAAVAGDNSLAIRAYERVLEVAPTDRSALNNLSLHYRAVGRLEEAEPLLERALERESFRVAFTNLARVRFELGEVESAKEALDIGVEALPEAEWVFDEFRIRAAFHEADWASAADLLASYRERHQGANAIAYGAGSRVRLALARGRLAEAEASLGEVDEIDWVGSHPAIVASNRAWMAALRGDTASAVQAMHEVLEELRASRPPADRRYEVLIGTLSSLRADDDIGPLYAEWVAEVPVNQLGVGGVGGRMAASAQVARAEGDAEEAIRLWRALETECPGVCKVQASLGLALIYDDMGEAGTAVAEYERYLGVRDMGRVFVDGSQRAGVLERLGQLYDSAGDSAKAARYYTLFADQWTGADEELQPRVRAARARASELGGAAQ